MANTRDIRRRIKSVKNTAQITKAMQMVAASKMRRAQQAATAGVPYSDSLNKVLVSLRDHVDASAHPLLEVRQVKRTLVLVVSTDKGLCGALNTNLLREVYPLIKETTDFIATGKKAVQYLVRNKRNLVADFPLSDMPTAKEAKQISKLCIEKFLSGEVDEVHVLYTKFINTLNLKPTLTRLLPISSVEASGRAEDVSEQAVQRAETMLFEPNAHEVLNTILPFYVHFQIYQMILNARAAEHSARMVAMKSATDNAQQLIKDLTLEYNKLRQAAITNELLEITTAQMALE
ncbi:MAG: ATP synthase F1 subunit gamma [Chthoniobacterales bacterium]